jgi:hypothetical protein
MNRNKNQLIFFIVSLIIATVVGCPPPGGGPHPEPTSVPIPEESPDPTTPPEDSPVPTSVPTSVPTPASEDCTCDRGCDAIIPISADFTQNGAGEFCWQIRCVGSYINCWNLDILEINGVDFTNRWANPSSFPEPINGCYYIYYKGSFEWSHFEAVGICEEPVVTPSPTGVPGETDTPSIPPAEGAGDVWLVPSDTVTNTGSNFITELHINTGNKKCAAYVINITFNRTIVEVNTDVGESGVEAGAYGFISAVNAGTAGTLRLSGFDTGGKGPGEDLHFLTINWRAVGPGYTLLNIDVEQLVDESTNVIGIPNGIDGGVTVSGSTGEATPDPAPVETPEPTEAQSPEPTPTPPEGCTCVAGCDAIIPISADFTQAGSGEFCWQINCIGSHINSWNLATLEVNGVDFTNTWVSYSSLPEPINGVYYIYYKGNYAWSHFEARGTCE